MPVVRELAHLLGMWAVAYQGLTNSNIHIIDRAFIDQCIHGVLNRTSYIFTYLHAQYIRP